MGRHAGLKFQWGNPCGFESRLGTKTDHRESSISQGIFVFSRAVTGIVNFGDHIGQIFSTTLGDLMAETYHLNRHQWSALLCSRSGTPAARNTASCKGCAAPVQSPSDSSQLGDKLGIVTRAPTLGRSPEDRDAITLAQCIDRALAFKPQIRQADSRPRSHRGR